MGIGKSKVQTDKELEKTQKNEVIDKTKKQKKVTFDLTNDVNNSEISVENIDKFIDELLNDKNINIKYIPDLAEREIYKNVFLLLIRVIDHTIKSSKIEFLGHEITLSLKPTIKN